jgi:drug/metabolite transporter (DMT)-like permease
MLENQKMTPIQATTAGQADQRATRATRSSIIGGAFQQESWRQGVYGMDQRRARIGSVLVVVVSAACFSTLAIFTTLAYGLGAQPLPLLTWRFLLVSALLAGWLALTARSALRVSRTDLLRFAALAVLGYGAASVCFFFALRFADASIVAVLLYTYPAMVAVASAVFLRERLTPLRIGALLLTFGGSALVLGIVGGAPRTSWQGIALGLGAALGYTVFNMLSYRWLPGRSRLAIMTYTFGIAGLAIGVLALLSGASLVPAAPSWALLAVLLAIVLIPTFLAVVLYFRAMPRLGPAQASIISTLEPVFTIGLAWAVLGERLGPIQLFGVALVLAGVVLAEYRPQASGPQDGDEIALV